MLTPSFFISNPSYEWCMTDKYDPENEEHNEIKHGIEVGDALPPINTCEESIQKMKEAVRLDSFLSLRTEEWNTRFAGNL